MRSFLCLLALCISASAYSSTATVLEVVPGDVPFAKLDNGEVRFIEGKALLQVGDVVETDAEGFDLKDSTFTPTVLKEKDSAVTLFERMRTKSKWRSQCYNRAHVWSYEEFGRSGTKLNKTFIFFTSRYIRNYRFKWWFHVAPSTVVEENGVKQNVVLDPTFFDQPELEADWALHFMYSKASCPVVTKYSDYDNHQDSEDCYLIRTSMFFWQPLDIEAYEQSGKEKSGFIPHEVKQAYRNAF